MTLTIRLDADLQERLRDEVKHMRLDWNFLPATLQQKILVPYLKLQKEREASLLEGLGVCA